MMKLSDDLNARLETFEQVVTYLGSLTLSVSVQDYVAKLEARIDELRRTLEKKR